MLDNYIRQYIKLLSESTKAIMMEPHKISSRLQSKISPTLKNDKTDLSPEQTIQDLHSKFGKDYMITFVNKYDEDIPDLSINPKAGFATPHGTYSYMFNKENFSKMMLSQRIRGVDFATNRPYFHIFKITTKDKVHVNADGTNSKYENSRHEYLIDLKEAVRVSLMSIPEDGSTIPNRDFINKSNYMSILNKDMFKRARTVARLIYNCYDAVCLKAPASQKVSKREFFDNIADFLDRLTDQNRYVRGSENIKDKVKGYLFLKLYSAVYYLSYITPNPKKGVGKSNDPSRFALILQSIGIKSIIDDGFGLIHHKQPSQALTINYGGKKEDSDEQFSNYELLGTYNNIFQQLSEQELEDLYVHHADYLH